MKKLDTIIKAFFSNAKNQLLVAGASAILLLFFLNKYNYNRYEDEKAQRVRTEDNLKAAQDTIRVSKTKDNKTVEYNKLSYIVSDLKELKEINASLAKEVSLTRGQVAAIQKISFEIKHDTIEVLTKSEIRDSTIYLKSRFDTTYSPGNFRTIAFQSSYSIRDSVSQSFITEDRIGITAVTGVKKNQNNKYEIFVRSNYPGLQINSLEGAVLEDNLFKTEKSKRTPLLSIGGNIGWAPFGYDFRTRKADFNISRITANIGLNFNIGAILK